MTVSIGSLAQKRYLSLLLVALLSFGGSWAIALSRGMPVPLITDEFSYLLAADTFAHGHLTNPPHALWPHFETFHELMQPSYMSKYPPGQGLFLALGQVLFGHPAFGVWISDGLMCAALCWMLYAWLPPRWALVGGLVAVMQFGVFTYWSQSYWGGAVTAMGEALVFGALPRIFKYVRTRDALWLTVGIALILNSRPLDGLLAGGAVGCLLLPWKRHVENGTPKNFLRRIIMPVVTVLLLTLGVMGAYNKKVTGHVFLFPHRVYAEQYSSVPLFLWQGVLHPPVFRHSQFQQHDNYERGYFLLKKKWPNICYDVIDDTSLFFHFYLDYPLAMAGLCGILFFYRKKSRLYCFLLVLLIFLAEDMSLYCRAYVHYFSWAAVFVVFFITIGLRLISRARLMKVRIGAPLVAGILVFQFMLNVSAVSTPSGSWSWARSLDAGSGLPRVFTQEQLREFLTKKGGKHLVIVKYLPNHNFFREWVHNAADIDRSSIIWARSMDATSDAKLVSYFKDRHVWSIEVCWDRGGLDHEER